VQPSQAEQGERNMNRYFIFISVFLLLIGSTLAADPGIRWEAGVGATGNRLLGGEKGSTWRSGVGLSLSFFVAPWAAIAWQGDYCKVTPRKDEWLMASDPAFPWRTFLFENSLETRLYLTMGKRIFPFFSIGMGLLRWDVRDYTNGEALLSDGFFYGQSLYNGIKTSATMHAGIGVEYRLAHHWSTRLSLRYSHIFDQRFDNLGTGDINDRILRFGVSINYLGTKQKDSDGDGIIDRHDAAPLQAEDFDGFQDEDGIPDYDNDQDGVPDSRDAEPLIPEDRDGFEDDDGIPDPDNDWDGIPDHLDQAPNEPEDFDGFQDEDGKPDLDDDSDGIADLLDQCKKEAETYNQYRDDDGCPDEVPPPLAARGERLVLQGVNFAVGSADLTPDSYARLDQVYESLYLHPDLLVEIRGHTDSSGSDAINDALSLARAETVRKYLINKGIDSHRISAVGMGSKEPIADNASEAGRAKNRRIEFVRLN